MLIKIHHKGQVKLYKPDDAVDLLAFYYDDNFTYKSTEAVIKKIMKMEEAKQNK